MTGGLYRGLLESRVEQETCLSERNDRLLETDSAEFCLNCGLRGTGGSRPSWLSSRAGEGGVEPVPWRKQRVGFSASSREGLDSGPGWHAESLSRCRWEKQTRGFWDGVSAVTREGLGRK